MELGKRRLVVRLILMMTSVFGAIESMDVVNSRKCLPIYDADNGYFFDDSLMSQGNAIGRCVQNHGKLPMSTEVSWKQFLEYIRSKAKDTKYSKEGTWIGVTVQNSGNLAKDVDGLELNNKQLNELAIDDKKLNEETMCVAYFPPIDAEKDWHFKLQACSTAQAKVACKCVTDVRKDDKIPSRDKATRLPIKDSQKGFSSSLEPSGRSAEGGEASEIIPDNPDGTEGASSTAPVIALAGLLATACLIATAYIISKKRNWNFPERIARRIPYHGPGPNVNGDSYHRGQELTEISSSGRRPVHVYEEIILQNSANISANGSTLLSNSSFATIPSLPPPDPPSPHQKFPTLPERDTGKRLDDGYLQPSFRRIDTIPGDVRSPPPIGQSVFNYPSVEGANILAIPKEKELKYASVETVQTLLDGGSANDEEYFVDDCDMTCGSGHLGKLAVEMPTKDCCSPECYSNSYVNSYTLVKSGEREKDDIATSYKNGPFLTASAKIPPVKPERKRRKSIHATENSSMHSRIAPVCNEEVSAQVNRKSGNELKILNCGVVACTPTSVDGVECKASEEVTEIAQRRENIHISSPSMLSTTNRALEDFSLVCYEIPPAFEDLAAKE